jgi:hypothetical protein
MVLCAVMKKDTCTTKHIFPAGAFIGSSGLWRRRAVNADKNAPRSRHPAA